MWKKICLSSVLYILAYGFLVEPNFLRVRYVQVANESLAKVLSGKKIALLSDMHFEKKETYLQSKLLKTIQNIKPDMILLTGDLVKWFGSKQAYINALNFLTVLDAPMGVYAVMGDADYSTSRYSCLFCHQTGSNFPKNPKLMFLRNSVREISTGSGSFQLIGIDGQKDDAPTALQFLEQIKKYDATIIISHSSVPFDHIKQNKIFMAAGDTHGGQIWLPTFLWKIFNRKPDPEHMYGFYQESGSSLYVSSGIGTSTLSFRFGVPPELAVFRFVP